MHYVETKIYLLGKSDLYRIEYQSKLQKTTKALIFQSSILMGGFISRHIQLITCLYLEETN